MIISLHEITIRDLFAGYQDSQEEGVVAYGGRLDVRPKYQREFVYTGKQREEVINTVRHGFPLNIMYWVKKEDGNFEVLDGQQRTISICQYLNNDFSIGEKYFHTLTDDQQAQILDYKLMVYFCEGTDSEKLDWFKIVNIAGEKLSDQELRNAVYTGAWLTDAKRHFSKTNCAGIGLGDKYVRCEVNRQGLLELVLKWISGGHIEQYMAEAQNKIDSIVSVLSKQERNIFEAILQEKSNKEICDELFISPRTVENYTSRLYAKIGVKNREELIERFK